MGLGFRKSIKLGKNVKLNLGKNGPNISTGPQEAKVDLSKRRIRTTIGKDERRYTKYRKMNNNTHNSVIKKNNTGCIEKTADKRSSSAANWKKCDIDNKHGKIPYPEILKNECMALLVLAVSGFVVHPVMFIFALIPALVILRNMLFNKQIKARNQQYYAIREFHLRNFSGCTEHCKKSLKYMEYESTRHLMQEAQALKEKNSNIVVKLKNS